MSHEPDEPERCIEGHGDDKQMIEPATPGHIVNCNCGDCQAVLARRLFSALTSAQIADQEPASPAPGVGEGEGE